MLQEGPKVRQFHSVFFQEVGLELFKISFSFFKTCPDELLIFQLGARGLVITPDQFAVEIGHFFAQLDGGKSPTSSSFSPMTSGMGIRDPTVIPPSGPSIWTKWPWRAKNGRISMQAPVSVHQVGRLY